MTKAKIILILITVTVSFGFGYWTAPYKTKTVTVEVEKKKTKEEVEREKHKKTTITETTAPDGTKTKKTEVSEDTDSQRHVDTVENSSKSETKEVTKSNRTVNLSLMAGIPLSFGAVAPMYGGAVSTSLIGPLTIGVWGLSNVTGGVSLGVNL